MRYTYIDMSSEEKEKVDKMLRAIRRKKRKEGKKKTRNLEPKGLVPAEEFFGYAFGKKF